MSSILIVDDEEGMRKSLSILFQKEGHRIYQAENGEGALDQLSRNEIDLVITDLRMDGMDGLHLLGHMRGNKLSGVPVIVMTAYGTIDSAVEAMRIGASDYIAKPFEYDDILHRAKRAIEHAATNREIDRIMQIKTATREDFSMITGESAAMTSLKQQLGKLSATTFPVLITGETGTGKNLVAKAVHLNSPVAGGPFLSVNCASIPEQLLESEFFGHTKGAFSGAIMERKGLFEAAHGGTILLDEIGSLPKPLQAKLLGVLQDKVIRRIGSNNEVPVDTRVIAATNSDIAVAIRKGEFREDLYYRINVLPVHIPPLRKHKEDIPLLAEHFLNKCKSDQGKRDIDGFVPEAMNKLYQHDYPGNVRELQNIICRAVAVSDPPLILCEDLLDALPGTACCTPCETEEPTPMDIKEWEKRIILQSIARHPNNLAEACKELKIGRTTLWRKMKQYKIELTD
jgi:DNA-binding NtrC family response regulator